MPLGGGAWGSCRRCRRRCVTAPAAGIQHQPASVWYLPPHPWTLPPNPAPPALPFVPPRQALGPVSPLLRTLATTQPWSALLCVLGSLLTAQFAFLAMPVLDVLLGRDLRQPTQVRFVGWLIDGLVD